MEEHMQTLDLEFSDEDAKENRKSVEPAADDDLEFEVVDDTPEEDRGRKPMDTPPEEPSDEELSTYSKRDRNRIREFTKGYHEERRAKESALREREEAIRLAQSYFEENKRLKGNVNTSNNALIEHAKISIAQELNEAKRKYKQAYEEGDSDGLVAAQEDLTSAKLKAERVNNFKPRPVEEEKFEPAAQPTTEAPPVDWKAEKWKDENKEWFGIDREMTGFAFALHDKLINEDRIDPTSDEYYTRLNGRLRQVFSDKFEFDEPADAPTQRPVKSNVVASATRSVAPKKIMLSQSEVNIAKRLGVPLDHYAREVARLRREKNG